MIAGMCESVATKCRRRSRPLMPSMRTSSTRQPMLSRRTDSRKASADANVSTRKPTDISRLLSDRRNDASSSTMQITRHLLGYAGYGRFFTGDFINETGKDKDSDFYYAALQYMF